MRKLLADDVEFLAINASTGSPLHIPQLLVLNLRKLLSDDLEFLAIVASTGSPLHMSVTLDAFHAPIGPVAPSKQLPCGNSLTHSSTAFLSSALVCGENAVVEGMSVWVVCLDWG